MENYSAQATQLGTPQKEVGIREAIDTMADAIGSLEESLDNLVSELGPVLLPSYPSKEQDNEAHALERSDIRSNLNDLERRIEYMREGANAIRNRLDI